MNIAAFLARAWYRLARGALQIAARFLFQCRVRGANVVPRAGPVLLISNHQSHIDPVLAAIVCPRRLRFMARDTLFVGPLGRLIASLGAIPVDREGTALSGIKRTMRCLADGEAVLIFPEGTRSEDGRLGELKPGFISLVRRQQPTLAVMAIDGAYDAWPREARIPRRRIVAVQFGRVIASREYSRLDDAALLALITAELRACLTEAHRLRRPLNRPALKSSSISSTTAR